MIFTGALGLAPLGGFELGAVGVGVTYVPTPGFPFHMMATSTHFGDASVSVKPSAVGSVSDPTSASRVVPNPVATSQALRFGASSQVIKPKSGDGSS